MKKLLLFIFLIPLAFISCSEDNLASEESLELRSSSVITYSLYHYNPQCTPKGTDYVDGDVAVVFSEPVKEELSLRLVAYKGNYAVLTPIPFITVRKGETRAVAELSCVPEDLIMQVPCKEYGLSSQLFKFKIDKIVNKTQYQYSVNPFAKEVPIWAYKFCISWENLKPSPGGDDDGIGRS